MNFKFLLFFWFLHFSLFSQVFVRKIPQRIVLSFENVAMQNESDLGFLRKGLDVFGWGKGFKNMYFGLHIFSAITGKRPGLITLGMETGFRLPLFHFKNLYFQSGFFVGAGGGGGASDGGGLIVRPHMGLEVFYKKLAFSSGFSKILFPSGNINSDHFFIATSFYTDVFWESKILERKEMSFGKNPIFKNIHFSVEGMHYFDFSKNSIQKNHVKNAQVLGIFFRTNIRKNLYNAVRLQGALGGGIDGYMSVLAGLAYDFQIFKSFKISPYFLMGASGGGAVNTGGGATAQANLDLQIKIVKNNFLKLIFGKTWAPWGNFAATHFGFGFAKEFEILKGLKNKKMDIFALPLEKIKKQTFGFSISNRTYFLDSDKKDKNNKFYLPNFQLLGFEFSKKINKKWQASGTTFWAYQGDYGAYAEGLFGLSYAPFIFNKNKFFLQILVGAAGGGGIDVGEGLLFQYGLGYERTINSFSSFFIRGFKMRPLSGNFTPYSLELGFQFSINQIFKK